MLTRFAPPPVLRMERRTGVAELTLKEAVARVVEEVVIVEPTLLYEEPPLVEAQSSQVDEPSVPNTACWIVTVPAEAKSKSVLIAPTLRMRAEAAPVLRSVERLPTSASSKNHQPVERNTSAAA